MSKRKMNGSKKNLLAAGPVLLAVLLLTSCTREDNLAGDDDGTLPALGLNALQAKDLSVVATRAATTTPYPTDKFIGFFVKENTTNGYPACDNRKGEYNTSRKLWLPVPDSIWLNNHDADIAVYAPYDATQTTAAKLKLAACLRPDDGSKDLWCKKFTANNKSTNLAPVLEHVYTRFIINLSLDADYKGTAPVDSVSLDNDSLYAAGAFRPFETTLYEHEGDAGVGFTLSPAKTLTTAATTASIDLLLIPATLTQDIKVSLRVNGITFGVKIASSRFSGKLEAGKQYNANVKLKPTALEVTSVTINDWNDVTVSGDKEPVFTDPILLPIDIGLDFVIAPGNVRAIKLSDGTYAYEFAEEQGYYSGGTNDTPYNSLGGDYFCWNTLDPNLTTGNINDWNEDFDPCLKIADGKWHTPTPVQLQAMIDAGKVWGESIYTMKDGTKVNGYYFGTTKVPSQPDQNKYVFLPVAGLRDGNRWDLVNIYGYYWSNTPNGNIFTYSLYFYNNFCSVGSGANRHSGRPIRCVRSK